MRLFGATVAGLAVLLGPVGTAGAAIGPSGAAGSTGSTGDTAVVRPFAAGSDLELRLSKVTPAAPGPNDELVVTGTARNLSSTPLKRVRLTLWLRCASPRRGQALLASRDTPARRAWSTALAPPARVGLGVGLVSRCAASSPDAFAAVGFEAVAVQPPQPSMVEEGGLRPSRNLAS